MDDELRALSLDDVVGRRRDGVTELPPGWLVIGISARGRDLLCLDLSATGEGQVVELIVDAAERPVVAPSFGALLGSYFEQLQCGEIEIDDDEDDIEDDD